MKRWTTCIALLLLVGCNLEDNNVSTSLTVQSVDASDACANGGLLITIDANEYLVCNGEDGTSGENGTAGDDATISSRLVGPGEADNPCEAGALEVTITSSGEEPTVEYVCEAYDEIDHTLGALYDDLLVAMSAVQISPCDCQWEDGNYGSLEECVADNEIPYSIRRYVSWCSDMALHVYDDELPAGSIELITCEIEALEAQLNCYSAVDNGNACEPANIDAVETCLADLANTNCFELIDQEEVAEFDNYFQFVCGDINF